MTPADKPEPVALCMACEGKPAPENNPCAVCGASTPEPVQAEPVAWMYESSGGFRDVDVRRWGDLPDGWTETPLYTCPTPDLAERIEGLDELALRVATDAHRGQVDKGGQPYIWHPIRVAAGFQTEALRAVALLHDVLEDSTLTAYELEKAFGPVVADAVVCLTRKPGQSYSDFIRQCAANPMARAVKLRDLADNMDESRLPQPLTASDVARLAKYTDASAILTALKEVNSHDRT